MLRGGGHLHPERVSKCFRGVFEIRAFEDEVDFCPRNVGEKGEQGERWYWQSLGGRKWELCGPAVWSPG